MTDKELIELKELSCETWQETIYNEYFNYVYTIIFSKLKGKASPEDIEECVADVFADFILFYSPKSKSDGDLKGYISQIAKNKASDQYKRIISENNRIPISEVSEMADFSSDMESDIEDKQIQKIILDEIIKLGEPDSTILLQKFFYERNSHEISKIIDIKPSYVRKRCSRALKKLRQKLISIGIKI